jgi:hypothetical protein
MHFVAPIRVYSLYYIQPWIVFDEGIQGGSIHSSSDRWDFLFWMIGGSIREMCMLGMEAKKLPSRDFASAMLCT